jgi:hypothetical protein
MRQWRLSNLGARRSSALPGSTRWTFSASYGHALNALAPRALETLCTHPKRGVEILRWVRHGKRQRGS